MPDERDWLNAYLAEIRAEMRRIHEDVRTGQGKLEEHARDERAWLDERLGYQHTSLTMRLDKFDIQLRRADRVWRVMGSAIGLLILGALTYLGVHR